MRPVEEILAGIGVEVELVEIALLSGGPSPRLDGLNAAHIRQLARLDQELPPLVVHRGSMCVVDGAHRLAAARSRGLLHVPVVYFDGTADDAFIAAVRLNTVHGKTLTARDRAAAVRRILASHPDWSDRWISAVCGTAARTVAAVRKDSGDDAQCGVRLGRDGRRRPLSAQTGRRTAEEIMREDPAVSVRRVAQMAGVSIGTVQSVRRSLQADGEEGVGGGVRVPLDLLVREPSLRYTERGRALLRLLTMTVALLDRSGPVTGTLPDHCRPSLQTVARFCARSWLDLADEVEEPGEGLRLQPGEGQLHGQGGQRSAQLHMSARPL